MLLAAAFGLAFLLALVLTPAAVRLAWATAYLDQPEARKLHASATALLGGVAVLAGALAAWGLLRPAAAGGGPGGHRPRKRPGKQDGRQHRQHPVFRKPDPAARTGPAAKGADPDADHGPV